LLIHLIREIEITVFSGKIPSYACRKLRLAFVWLRPAKSAQTNRHDIAMGTYFGRLPFRDMQIRRVLPHDNLKKLVDVKP